MKLQMLLKYHKFITLCFVILFVTYLIQNYISNLPGATDPSGVSEAIGMLFWAVCRVITSIIISVSAIIQRKRIKKYFILILISPWIIQLICFYLFTIDSLSLIILFGCILVLLSLLYLISLSLVHSKNNAPEINNETVQVISSEKYTESTETEIFSMFSSNKKHANKNLKDDLRIPQSEVLEALESIGIKYGVDISEEASIEVHTIQDILDLIKSRKN